MATPQFLAIVTKSNSPWDWMDAGRVFMKTQIELQKMGYYVHPVSQALQGIPRLNVQRRLNQILRIRRGSKIQMLLRVGRPLSMEGQASLRRAMRDLWFV